MKMKMKMWKAQRVAKNQNVDEKVENLRKATKCYISSPARVGATKGMQRQRTWVRPGTRAGLERRAANRKTPFFLRLPPDAITANEETSCRPPFSYFFFVVHSHIYTHTHTATYPVAFDNSPQNVKNDEKLATERGDIVVVVVAGADVDVALPLYW